MNNSNQTNSSILYMFQPENDSASQKGATSDSRPPTTRAPSSLSSTMTAAAASTIEDEEVRSHPNFVAEKMADDHEFC